jgi:CBS domain-containing protein
MRRTAHPDACHRGGGGGMKVAQILQAKSSEMATVQRDRPIAEVVALLRAQDIGAVIVVEADGTLAGILSERDIVRALDKAPDLATLCAADLMTAEVAHCEPHHDINEVMKSMTTGRFRHMPVMDNGRLAGLVSIGDAVRARIDELEREREALQHYIAG